MLTLPIKKQWFDMILSGEKKEEYRKISPYYGDRFYPYIRKYKAENPRTWVQIPASIRFRNGYSSGSPSFVAICTIDIGEGRPEWGAEPGRRYYRLHIEHVIPENLGSTGWASPAPTGEQIGVPGEQIGVPGEQIGVPGDIVPQVEG